MPLEKLLARILPHGEIWPLKITGKIRFSPKDAPKHRSSACTLTRYDGHQRRTRRRKPIMAQKIFISAGEASGEHYGALLADALQKQLAASARRPASSAWVVSACRCRGLSVSSAPKRWPSWG